MKEILRDDDNYLIYREEIDGNKYCFIMNKEAIAKIKIQKEEK